LATLCRNFDASLYEAFVVMPADGDAAREMRDLGAKVCFDPGITTIPRSLSVRKQLHFWNGFQASVKRVADLAKQIEAKILHVNSEACWVGGMAAKLAGIPVVTHLHGLSVLSPMWVAAITVNVLNKLSTAMIATSEAVRSAYVAKGLRNEIVHVIHNGVDATRFDPRRTKPVLRTMLNLSVDQPLIGMIGNFDPRKGHHCFVEACSIIRQHLPNARYAIIGDKELSPRYAKKVEMLIREKGMLESMHLFGPRADIPDVLRSLDIVVQPSFTEAGPRVPIEAMAMEKPLVATDVGGNREEVIHGFTGLLVPAGAIKQQADAVLRLLAEPGLAAKLGRNGRELVLNKYTEQVYAEKVQILYDRLLRTSDVGFGLRPRCHEECI
jgi:glycosyltransferase involved in cell wall biosynthesis